MTRPDDPKPPATGTAYLDTDKVLHVWDGSEWKEAKYYCDLDKGTTKDGLDIHTLHWISGEIIKLQTTALENNPHTDIHRYSPVHRIISEEMSKEIGT